MKNLKYYLLFFLVHQSCFLLVAQIQPGTPWMNQLNQGTTLEGNGQEFIRQAEMHAQLYDIERATQALDNAVNFAPNSVEPLVRRAVFNRRIGRMYEAELDINRVNQLNPYAANLSDKHYYVIGYKGTSPYDAGLFYCPYVPLQMVRSIDPDTFQPKIGFKTRYGMVSNPFVTTNGTYNGTPDGETLSANANMYYRRVQVTNLM
jgi:hypothetical protein